LVCATFAGAAHASSEYSPEDWIMAASFWLVLVEACALPTGRRC